MGDCRMSPADGTEVAHVNLVNLVNLEAYLPCVWGSDSPSGCHCTSCLVVAALEAQQAEIERLRAAGGALVEALQDARRRHPCDCADGFDGRSGAAALIDWEARRG